MAHHERVRETPFPEMMNKPHKWQLLPFTHPIKRRKIPIGILVFGYLRQQECIQLPNDIFDLIFNWIDKTMDYKTKPDLYEIRVWVCIDGKDEFIPALIKRYWSIKRVIQHILDINGNDTSLYKKAKLFKITYLEGYCYYWRNRHPLGRGFYPHGLMSPHKRAEEKLKQDDKFMLLLSSS